MLAELQSYGFRVAPYAIIRKKEDALAFARRHGFPVVVKLAGGEHKTDVGGVLLNIYDEEMLASALSYFKRKFKRKPLLIQKQITDGLELYMGIKADETFGRVVLFGLGGVYVEVFKDVTSRVCPIDKTEAERMVHELRSSKLLEGYRGRKFNVEAITEALVKLCRFAEKKKAKEIDLNPIMLTEEEAIVVDARMR